MEKHTARDIGMDFAARLLVGTMFAMLSFNLLGDVIHTHRLTALWLLISESLVVVLTILRRRARIVDRTAGSAFLTCASLVGPVLLRTVATGGIVPDAVTALVGSIGLIIVIAGKMTLGRSFGIAPANRGVVIAGPYTIVRHPIYTGYLLTHIAFAFAHPTIWNAAVLLFSDAALILRALHEERLLSKDDSYQSYCQRVGWHLMPGVF
jgi:protein-S-isoprenylcysteine O-methyltransferase Ste14